MIDEAYLLVEHFQHSANQPVSQKPVELPKQRVDIRAKWMYEELEEFIETFELYGGEFGFHTISRIIEVEIKNTLL